MTRMDMLMKIRIMCKKGNRASKLFCWSAVITIFFIARPFLPDYAYAKVDSPAFRPDMKALGMGGAFIAAGDNANALAYNPALLSRVGFDLVIPSLRFRLDSDFWDIANFVVDHKENFAVYDTIYSGRMDSSSIEELDEFLDAITPYENQWGKTRFAPMFSLSFKNFGLGIFNTTDIWIKADKGIYNPKVYGQAISDLVFLTGYSQQIRRNVTVGLTGKYISRRTSGLISISATDLDGTNEVLKPAYDQLKSDERGGGLDFGVLYTHRPHLDFGFVLHDAIGWMGSKGVRRNLKAGVAYQWGPLPLLPFKSGVCAADLEDLLFTTGESFFNRLHFGAATSFLVFGLRAGFNQGYPSVGVGINLLIFKIDYAYYGEELGPFPGHDAEWFHTLQLAIGW